MGARQPRAQRPKEVVQPPSKLWKAGVLAFGVTWLAMLIRWWPLTQYNLWGSDVGEYAGLMETYLGTGGTLPTAYTGWSSAYADFKGMYIIAGTFAQISGLDSFYVLSVVIPAAAALSALFAFVITLRLSRSLFAATVAGGIVAVSMPEAFAGSHAMPGALGGMMLTGLLAAVVLSVRSRISPWLIVALALAIIPTHHLSSYLGALMLSLGALLEARYSPRDAEQGRAVDAALIGGGTLILGSSLFWAWGAPQFFGGIIMGTSSTIGRILPGLGLLGATVLVIAAWFFETRPRDLARFRGMFDDARTLRRLAIAAAAPVVALGFLVAIGVPGTNTAITWQMALPFVPLGWTLGAIAPGVGRLIPARGAVMVFGAAIAVVLSGVIATVFLPHILFPYRHMQYLVEVGAPIAAVAVAYAARTAGSLAFPAKRHMARATATVLIAALLGSCLFTTFPTKSELVGFQEGTVDSEVAALVWMTWDIPGAYVATDHRLSSMTFGFAYQDASWEASTPILTGTDKAAVCNALATVKSPSGGTNVTIVLVSDDVVGGAALSQWDAATPLSAAAMAKFDTGPFVRAFDNGDAVAWWATRPCLGA
jgi:hypothetical protein